jgi:tRNA pseudouridine13 synthase
MPLIKAEIRRTPDDFQVTEILSPEFTGEGEHAYLWIRKTGANTEWTARQLARFAGIPVRDVGFSGMKDRHAVTWQWFSVRAPESLSWGAFEAPGVEILDVQRDRRKLKRGAHRANRFRIALRSDEIAAARDRLQQQLQLLQSDGVANYFGAQRFGRDGGNLKMAADWCAGKRLPRHKRGIAISAARSAIFNAILDARVANGSWNRILPGEKANLAGSGSVFSVDEVTDELQQRCAEFDIHPTGTLWGDGAPLGEGEVADIERDAALAFPEFTAGLVKNRVEAASRPLRLVVADLSWEFEEDVLWLEFELAKGGFATTVLGQLAQV